MRVAVIGAGIVGLACAEELLRAGHEVRVFDPAPGAGATHAAAGMLAPAGEAWHGELDLFRLGLASARLLAAVRRSAPAASAVDVDLRTGGTLLVGRTTTTCSKYAGPSRSSRPRTSPTASWTGARRAWRSPPWRPGCRRGTPARRPQREPAQGRGGARAAARYTPGAGTSHGRRRRSDRLGRHAVPVRRGRGRHGLARPVPGRRRCGRSRGETVRLRASDPPTRVRARAGARRGGLRRARGPTARSSSARPRRSTPPSPSPASARWSGCSTPPAPWCPGSTTAELLEITARRPPRHPRQRPADRLGHAWAGAARSLAVGHYRGGVLLAPVTAEVVRAYVEDRDVPDVARPFTPSRFGPQQTATPTDHRKASMS